jgi:hypothetical protein
MKDVLKILGEIEEYSQISNQEVKEVKLIEIKSKLQKLPSKEIEYLFSHANSNKFPENLIEEIKFEYMHRGGKI